jgi:hypothetical protein
MKKAMRPYSIPVNDWMDTVQRDCETDREEAEGILRSITRSFDQVNLATEFFLLKEDPKKAGPELQLACLIKDRIAQIEEQVSELYQIMNRQPKEASSPMMRH